MADLPPLEDFKTPYDPMLGVIRVAKETGRSMSEIPNPLTQLVGNAMMTIANQHEAVHLSTLGLMQMKKFTEAGGFDAIVSDIRRVIETGEPPKLS